MLSRYRIHDHSAFFSGFFCMKTLATALHMCYTDYNLLFITSQYKSKKRKPMNQKPEKNLVLIGFMGCGKSSVAAALGRHCQMEVVEMDQMIAGQQGLSIPEIFERYGEEYFRDLETALLRSLQGRNGCVVSCGGGVPLRRKTLQK